MNIGTQIIAREALGPLVGERTYYLLAHQSRMNRVVLVWFVQTKPTAASNGLVARAHVIYVDQTVYEEAALHGVIQPAAEQRHLPPWLDGIGSSNPATIDQHRKKAVSNEARVWRRVEQIRPAVERFDEIIASSNIPRALNRFAEQARTNTLRFRTNFFTFMLFGQNPWALMPTYHRVGHWNRGSANNKQALGRVPCSPRRLRAPRLSEADRLLISQTYRRYHGLDIPLTAIYKKAMRRDWGCKAEVDEDGHPELYHPNGRPFPTIRQYQYELHKTIGQRQLQIDRRGPEFVRNRHSRSRGKFTEHTANLMDRVESDGSWSKSHPTGPNGETLPRLVIVRLVDSTTACRVGVGFSYAAEREEAYLAAKFCAAIGLSRYISLFGLDNKNLKTPSAGLPRTEIVDRGPGSGRRMSDTATFRELAPTHSGQSKSIVESSHPRSRHDCEAPSYRVTHETPVQLAQTELWRVVQQNNTADASGRMTHEMHDANAHPSPIGIWEHLESRGRTAATWMSFNDAVRKFLKKVTFTVKYDGVFLEHLRYSSPGLNLEALCDSRHSTRITGYVLPMCVRHVWVEIHGKLCQLDGMLPFDDDDEQLYMSLAELQSKARRMRQARTAHGHNALAAGIYAEQEFEAQMGRPFDESVRRRGRAKIRTQASRDTIETLKGLS